MSDPHGTRIAASAVGGAVGNYVGGKFDIKGANGLPDLTKSIVKNVVSGIASNVANQLTQIALDGKGKLSWTSVAVSGINGVGSGVEEKRRHDEIITQQRAAQGNTTSVNGNTNGSNQAGGSISLTQARPMGVVIDNPPEAWDNVGKYNPNGLNVSWTDSPAQQNANNGGLNVTYPYDDNAAQKSITARKAAAATRKIVNANAQNFNVPNLDYIGLSGNVQNGTSVTLSSGLRRVSQQAVDYANLPKWSDRMPTTPAGTYRDVEGFVRTITPTSGNAADAMLKALPNAAINTINFIGQLGAVTGGGDYTSIPTFKYQNEALGMAAELAMTGPFAELAATSRLGRVGVAASAGIEAQFLTNSQRVTDESYKLFVQGIKDESIPRNPKIPYNTQAGGFVDARTRLSNLNLRDELGLDANTVRINQRLYASDGSYTIPDIIFPKSGNVIDYSLQLKTVNTPQIQGFRSAAPSGTITIVAPSAIRPTYIIGQ